jgi:hypothetical protein
MKLSLCLLKHHAMRYGGAEIQLQTFLALAVVHALVTLSPESPRLTGWTTTVSLEAEEETYVSPSLPGI